MDSEKIQAIRNHLLKLFPTFTHEDRYLSAKGQEFLIITQKHTLTTLLTREFVEDNSIETIISKLKQINLKSLLTDNPKSIIVIGHFGIRIEPSN